MSWKDKVVLRRFLVFALAGGLLVAGLGIAAYTSIDGAQSASPYRVVATQSGPVVSIINASGSLKPRTIVSITAPSVGQVKEVLVDFNSKVEKGDPLASLVPDAAQAKVAMAKADLEVANGAVEIARAEVARAQRNIDNARATVQGAHADLEHAELSLTDATRDLKRKRELSATGDATRVDQERASTAAGQANSSVLSARAREQAAEAAQAGSEAEVAVTQAQLRNAEATVTAKQAALQQAELELAQTVIRAPISGVVVERNIAVGQSVSPSSQTPLFSIAQDLNALEVHASIDEADIGRVHPGQDAALSFDAYPGQSFEGRVLDVHKMPEVVQGVVSYDVVISADNTQQQLLPGMTADVRIIAGEAADTLKVPNAALRFHPKDVRPAAVPRAHDDAVASAPASPLQAASAPGDVKKASIWRLGRHGKPEEVSVSTGLSDGVFTQIVAGDIAAGDEIIVGMNRPSQSDKRAKVLKF